ncbi:hypothetical protein MMC30_004972 [Trapelia coarctata]|nr:hypothetical protein [Trapelia coarctata]
MAASSSFDLNYDNNDFEDFLGPGWDLPGAELNTELDESAWPSPFVPSCMQGREEVAIRTMTQQLTDGTNQNTLFRSSDTTTSPFAHNELTATDEAYESRSLETPGKNFTDPCTCPTCTAKKIPFYSSGGIPCVLDCGKSIAYHKSDFMSHYKAHFEDEQGQYRCKVSNCNTTVGRWGELTRHYRFHCLKPQIFPCDVIGCKYGGANGFKRKDKLLSHKRNVHDGKAAPDQLLRKRKLAPKA